MPNISKGVMRMVRHMTACLTVVLCLMMTSCKPEVPDDVIQPDDMADILYDIHMARAAAQQTENPSVSKVAYSEAVLLKHDVTKADFDSSMVYYYTHAEELNKIYKKIVERVQNEAARVGADIGEIGQYQSLSENGDTANIWKTSPQAILSAYEPYNRMDFTVKADTAFRVGDTFQMNFTSDFFFQGGVKSAVACILVRYENDSTIQYVNHVRGDGVHTLRIPYNDSLKVKELNGFIYLNRPKDKATTAKLLFIDKIQLVRMRRQKAKVTATDNAAVKDSFATSSATSATVATPNRAPAAAHDNSSKDNKKPAVFLAPDAKPLQKKSVPMMKPRKLEMEK